MANSPEAKHSPIGASSMHRWRNCPGSVRLSRGITPVTSAYAEEGTKAHEIAANVLTGKPWPNDIDAETIRLINIYTAEVNKYTSEATETQIECRFDLSKIYPGLFGTADCVQYFKEKKHLKVYDLKYGSGIAVEVESNEQLMYYALGALMQGFPVDTVELIIVQPRCAHPQGVIRSWTFPSFDLLEFAADLHNYAKATEGEHAPLNPGDWCRFCPAAGICPELHQKAVAIAKQEFAPQFSYDPAKLSDTLQKLPVLEAFIKSVREFAYSEAVQGRVPPGFKLVAKRATRKWRDDGEVGKFLSQRFMESVIRECYTDPELKSPAQVEKIVGKLGMKDLIPFMSQESSGNTLAPVSDPRPQISNDAKTEFETVELFE